MSLNKKSFQDYFDNFKNPDHKTQYFGWFASDMPDYDMSASIPTTVFTRTGGQRPEIVPHQSCDHQLVRDYYEGISKTKAKRRIQAMMDGITPPPNQPR